MGTEGAVRLLIKACIPLCTLTPVSYVRKYHETAVGSLNGIVRRYNAIAPYSVRRPLLVLQRELDTCFSDSIPIIESEILRILEGGGNRLAGTTRGNPKGGPEPGQEQGEVQGSMWMAFKRLVREVVGTNEATAARGQ